MFCKYCGKQVPEGETCSCRKNQSSQSVNMQPPLRSTSGKTASGQPPLKKISGKTVPDQPRQKSTSGKTMAGRPPQKKADPYLKPAAKTPSSGRGKGMITAAFVCSILMIVLFILLRFVLADVLSGISLLEGIYPYLMYALPLLLGIAGLLLGIFSMQDARIRIASAAGIMVSAIGLGCILGTMVFFPYEGNSYASSDWEDEDEDEEEDRDEEESQDGEESPREDKETAEAGDLDTGGVSEIEAQYQAGQLDYVQAKQALDALDEESLESEEAEKILAFQEKLEQDLETQMGELAAASNYKQIMETLNNMNTGLQEQDPFITGMLSKYEPEYILYLDTESRKLADAGKKEEAVKLLEEAQPLVEDSGAIGDMLLEIQNRGGTGEYVLADSSSRYLSLGDISHLSIQQINYAKNEIYARHGRKFKSNELQNYFNSKSWYRGTIEPSDFNQSVLNDYELKNAELLSDREFSMDSRGYQLDAN